MQTSNNFTKGLNQDIHPKYQPEGTYRYALNAVIETETGQLPSLSSEIGTYYCQVNWPTGKTLFTAAVKPVSADDIVKLTFEPVLV